MLKNSKIYKAIHVRLEALKVDDASYCFIKYTITRIQYYASVLRLAIAHRHNNVAILISRKLPNLTYIIPLCGNHIL